MPKFLKTSIATILLSGLFLSPVTAAFPDVNQYTLYNQSITYAQNNSIVGGFSDGKFYPTNEVTRGEFTKIVINSLFDEPAINSCSDLPFPDVTDENVFKTFICVAKANDIVGGFSDGNYYTDRNITAAESFKIISNAYEYTSEEDLTGNYPNVFFPYTNALSNRKIIPESILTLNAPLLRNELTEIIYRIETNQTTNTSQTFEDLDIQLQVLAENYLNEIDSFGEPDPTDIQLDTFTNIVSYNVDNYIIQNPTAYPVIAEIEPLKTDYTKQGEIWQSFLKITPQRVEPRLLDYYVATDGDGNIIAQVEGVGIIAEWIIYMDIQDMYVSDKMDKPMLIGTTIHEYAHMLSLDETQVDIFALLDNDNCGTNFNVGYGCARDNSYINQFYQRYWTDIIIEHSAIDPNSETYVDDLFTFYEKYQDRFVTFYSSSEPAEDIAESFTVFVLSERRNGSSISDQKVNFFYEYPELVAIRDEIRSNLL